MCRSYNPRIPLIAVTANSDPDLKRKSQSAGFDDFLLKPLTVESIRHVMLKHLNKAKLDLKKLDAA